MSSASINQLLQNNSLWQASQKGRPRPALSTGYDALDKELHYAGWPQGIITEFLLSKNGIGELRLLSPLLARLGQQPGFSCWINPPFQPYAPALTYQQINLEQLVIVKAKTLQETIWAAQQAMKSNACSSVLTWLPKKVLTNEIRKLVLAAKASQCWGFIFRDQSLQRQSSAAGLRLLMRNQQAKQSISIIKQPGGWSGQQVSLNLFPERAYWTAKPVEDWPDANNTKDLNHQANKPLRVSENNDKSLQTLTNRRQQKSSHQSLPSPSISSYH